MLSKEESDLLTQTGPETAMGELLRRYWLPAFLSERLPEPDCPPIGVRLLSEDLVAFRDTFGRVGLLREACPHRGASLTYARCEEGGIRCIYHGWKMDVEGRILEAPPERDPYVLGRKVRHAHYPTRELGGVIWTYMGPSEHEPAFPKWPFIDLPLDHILPVHYLQECNYFQAIEGDFDPSHASYLHLDLKAYRERHEREASPVDFTAFFGFDRSPRGQNMNMPWGIDSVWQWDLEDAERPGEIDPTSDAFIVQPFIAPCFSNIPGGGYLGPYIWHAWIPVDDDHHILYYVHYDPDKPINEKMREEVIRYFGHYKCQPESDYKSTANRQNRHFQDRGSMNRDSFSGIGGIAAQDIAITQNQGTVDRTIERLGASDVGVIAVRKFLLRALKSFADKGEIPRPKSESEYAEIQGYVEQVPKGTDWREVTRDKVRQRRGHEAEIRTGA